MAEKGRIGDSRIGDRPHSSQRVDSFTRGKRGLSPFRALARLNAAAILLIIIEGYATSGEEWRWEEGSWKKEPPRVTDRLDQEWQEALALYNAKSYESASKRFLRLQKEEKNRYWFNARLMRAMCFLELGELEEAYKGFHKLLEDAPPEEIREGVLEGEMRIARQYLSGTKLKALGMRVFDGFDRAARILKEVADRDRSGLLAPEALLALGDGYFKRGDFLESALSYETLVKRFPSDERRMKAELYLTICRLKESRGPAYDPAPYIESRDALEDFLQKYGTREEAPMAQELLKEVKETLAEQEYRVAQYYKRAKRPEAARRYLQSLVDNYADTTWGKKAEKELAQFKSP